MSIQSQKHGMTVFDVAMQDLMQGKAHYMHTLAHGGLAEDVCKLLKGSKLRDVVNASFAAQTPYTHALKNLMDYADTGNITGVQQSLDILTKFPAPTPLPGGIK